MTLTEILTIMENRILALRNARVTAVNNGDLENVVKIDNDILTTALVIDELKAKLENGLIT